MILHGEHIRFRYPNSKQDTLSEFCIALEKGEILAILGESGSGKTTALRIIAGLEQAAGGTLVIDGKTMFSDHTFVEPERRGIGMVFQDYALFPHMTVKKNIQYGLKRKSPQEKERIADEMLRLVDLGAHQDKYPYELSGGQQQRVAIARALAYQPSILLLDEPFSNLDTNLVEKIREEIKRILKAAQITSIFVTHNKQDALSLADQVIILQDGRIVQTGPPTACIS